MIAIELAERRLLPDSVVRIGIRKLLRKRLRRQQSIWSQSPESERADFVQRMSQGPIAIETNAANDQHYEFPAEFFELVLGRALKYSCGWFETENTCLDVAEEAMLDLTCDRADIKNGMDILELGCGWGSLTLWMANRFPDSSIIAVSNSHGQREFIEARAKERGLTNVRVVTRDINKFDTQGCFDRVVSVEMFEHMNNLATLMGNVFRWLRPTGKMFVHTFCHKEFGYIFESSTRNDWMARQFFTGGMMPFRELLSNFETENFQLDQQWDVSGRHYWRTCEAWLQNLDDNHELIRNKLLELDPFSKGENEHSVNRVIQRWRMFFLACAELFRYGDGREWFVTHQVWNRT